jgi:hypothetical protein
MALGRRSGAERRQIERRESADRRQRTVPVEVERRSGLDRRMVLDRRSGLDRRLISDRRQSVRPPAQPRSERERTQV